MTIDIVGKTIRGLVKASRVAEEFGVTSRTVRNWCDAGLIPVACKVGRTMRFDLEEIRLVLAGAGPKAGGSGGPPQLEAPMHKDCVGSGNSVCGTV